MRCLLAMLLGLLLGLPAAADPGPRAAQVTWLSMANVHLQMGDLGMLVDGYVTRIPAQAFHGGAGLAYTHEAWRPDAALVARVLAALGGPAHVGVLFTGHSHWDHSFDTPVWWALTRAPIFGPRSTCLQVRASAVPEQACTALDGGERLQLAPGLAAWVVRWNHSGDPAENPEQHLPRELSGVPQADANGGLRAGVAEDFPNGGGSRALLFVADGPQGRFTWFLQGTGSAEALDTPVAVDGTDFGAPLENLREALRAAQVDHVDLWIATGGLPMARRLVPLLRPRAYLPVHWDGLFRPFLQGVAQPWSDPELERFLATAGVTVLHPAQTLDRWELDADGVRALPDTGAWARLTGTGRPPR